VLTTKDGVEQQRVVLEDGDLFVLGPRTNASLKHAVLPVKDEQIIERHGTAVEPRISIVLRDIKTQLSRAEVVATMDQSERGKARARQAKTPSQRPESQMFEMAQLFILQNLLFVALPLPCGFFACLR
jgi:hypothetical protein